MPLTPEQSDRVVTAALDAYTRRTDRSPVDGVCECYRDWTGLRIALRRPCPVHGTSKSFRSAED
jgi:hypothetical protein